MAKTRKEVGKKKSNPPSRTIEGRENQLISLAVDLAEKQLREGTASTQVIVHYLKLATTKTQLEKEKLSQENKLLEAKTDNLQSQKKTEELYRDALNAMKSYSGFKSEVYEEEEEL